MLILIDIALYPFGLTADQIVWWGFIAGVVAAVGVIVAIILTIYFGKKSLTKADLAPIEGNTAHLEEVKSSLKRIDKRDALDALAQQVSINVSGQADIPNPLTISFTLTNPSVTVERIQLFNEHGNVFGIVRKPMSLCTPQRSTTRPSTNGSKGELPLRRRTGND